MFPRSLVLPQNKSFFLFGARNTGKSTLIEGVFPAGSTLVIDLLDADEEARFTRDPNELYRIVTNLPESITHVVLDEVQKVPKLLDVVQRLLKKNTKCFVMTGSSARKLKRDGANLLAGRAFIYHFFPLTSAELGANFELEQVLAWGSLPEIFQCSNDRERTAFLNAYAHTYLKEEVANEQLVRNLDPFRKFLEVAAQCNGKILNYAKIARDVDVDAKTIVSYYSILEDTLLGFFLEPYHTSVRKRLSKSPKFYLFDTGVSRALARLTQIPLHPQTSLYGEVFEQFIILECHRLASYYSLDYRFSYLQTASNQEIDLIVDRPGQPLLCIEIKSRDNVTPEAMRSFSQITQDIPNCEAVCFSNDKYPKQIDNITVYPWQQGLAKYFHAVRS